MPRVKRSINAHKKRRKVLEEAKGYWGLKKSSYRRAKEQGIKSGSYAYRDRRVRKREFRRLWITRINAGAREHGLSYNQFIHGLKAAQIDVDRKMLADLAVREPEVFAQMAARAKEALAAAA
jgi:large subunit ribosomal protein L20